ncbi:MFS transporter [Amycolatopsis rhabdoformis]|uniref:MFS transporter n=1 Tax=Amycolatopsis rhabdoformis TaxID=1448059 RepID=A0ABZ1ILU3_9PSEU|nr:MFS transporter [Amycolatopsis rhabdoformis]WSE34697.1 MFS transporter [Amycolatopsis rhabdoformis]
MSVALLACGLLAIALNLRIGVASIGPVLPEVRADLGLSPTAASLLTTVPIFAFGAFAFLTPALIRRLGLHRLLGVTVLALAAGLVLRSFPGLVCLFAGTIVAGAAIAVANVVMPAAIKRDFAHRAGLMLGLYSTALFLGAALASGFTQPLVSASGHWRSALAWWAAPAVLALAVWLPQALRSPGRTAGAHRVADAPSEAGEPPFRAVLKDPIALAVTALTGIQSLGYYAALTWVPTLFKDHGMSAQNAGFLLSWSAFLGIAASLVAPAIAQRVRPTWLPIVFAAAITGVAYLGLALAPVSGAYAWMTLLGFGQGASISLSLSYLVWRSPDAHHTGHVSTMAQGFGYLFAGLGPVGLGALHSTTGEWTVPLGALALLLVPQVLTGVVASRERHVLAGRSPRPAENPRITARKG